jgi:hypothetical protein
MSIAAGTCLPSSCLETVLVYLLISRSLHISSSTCYYTEHVKVECENWERYSYNRDVEAHALQPLGTGIVFGNRMLGGTLDLSLIKWDEGSQNYITRSFTICNKKEPVQAVEVLRVARGWGSHIFSHLAHTWQQGCQPNAPAAFYPQENSWYSFLLEAESTPGP